MTYQPGNLVKIATPNGENLHAVPCNLQGIWTGQKGLILESGRYATIVKLMRKGSNETLDAYLVLIDSNNFVQIAGLYMDKML